VAYKILHNCAGMSFISTPEVKTHISGPRCDHVPRIVQRLDYVCELRS